LIGHGEATPSDADVGVAISEPDDEVPGLLERARAASNL